jgi:hypothetical protein
MRLRHAFVVTLAVLCARADCHGPSRTIFDGETHVRGMLASLSRAIRFASPPK